MEAEQQKRRPQEVTIALAGSSVDLVVSSRRQRVQIEGLRVRRVGDEFRFCPDPDGVASISAPDGAADHRLVSLPLFDDPPIETQAVEIDLSRENCRHRLVFPVVGCGPDPRFWWSIRAGAQGLSLVELDAIGRMLTIARRGIAKNEVDKQDDVIDMTTTPKFQTSLDPGEGFLVSVKGEKYAFQLLFRLVLAPGGPLELSFIQSKGRLRVCSLGGARVECTFLVTPVASRKIKFLGGRRTAGLRFSNTAIAVTADLPSRFLVPISSIPTAFQDYPVSTHPLVEGPSCSFPAILWSDSKNLTVPNFGPLAQRILASALLRILICGDVEAELVNWALTEFTAVGIATTSVAAMRNALPSELARQISAEPGRIHRFTHFDKPLFALVLPEYAVQWPELETIATEMLPLGHTCPTDIMEAWRKQSKGRLPALPCCADLAVGMIVALINRQRGRVTVDNGSQVPAYEPLIEQDLWLCSWTGCNTADRSDFILQLSMRGIAEFWATGMYAQLSLPLGKTSALGSASSLEESSVNLVRAWEQNDTHRLDEAIAVFEAVTTGVGPREILSSLANGYLAVFHDNLFSAGDGHLSGLRRYVNPMVLVVSEGHPGHNFSIELSACYWATYAAAFSAGKSSALIPTLLQEGTLSKGRDLQRQLRLLIHGYRSGDTTALGSSIQTVRRALGTELAHALEPAAFQLLKAAGADRIISISPLLLDFIPAGDTILGLEVPLSRLPADDPYATYLSVNMAAISSAAAGSCEGAACILGPSGGRDSAEVWARGMCDTIAQMLPFLGFSVPSAKEGVVRELSTAANAEVIFFVGHAMASDAWGGLDVGTSWIDLQMLSRIEWTGKVAILLGCETAALDSTSGDLAKQLIERGARAIVGTTAKVETCVAEAFLQVFLQTTSAGEDIDYAFFLARRTVVLAEGLHAQGRPWSDAFDEARATLMDQDPGSSFGEALARKGLTWDEVYCAAVYGLSFTLLGGATERLH